MSTEIWISGEDVALWRQVPRDRALVPPDDEDRFARSMLAAAQQSFDKGDEETAKWLVHWAQWLSDGRIGIVEFVELQSGVPAQSDSRVVPAVAEGSIESTSGEAAQSPADLPSMETPPAAPPPDHQTRQDPREANAGRPIPAASFQSQSTGGSLVVAAVSFAAGSVFCAALCTMLCFAPFRRTTERRIGSPVGAKCETPAPPVQPAEPHDDTNWIVQDFYNQNVELYSQMAQGN